MGVGLAVLGGLWIVILFDPQWLLASRGTTALLKLPVVLFVLLGLVLMAGVPSVPSWLRRWHWYPPLLGLAATGAVMVPFALNRGLARDGVQEYLLFWLMIVGTVTLVDTARRAELLIRLYMMQFIYFGIWGGLSGRVGWHMTLGNEDGFGSFMAIGLGFCAFLILAADKRWFRRVSYLAVALCVVGVVASFARGAALASLAVFVVVWIRSPRKGRTLGVALVATGLVMIASSVLHDGGFFAEVASVFSEGTQEGTTGEDRWELWKAAWNVFLTHPVFGVGLGNWGVFAAEYLEPGEIGSRYVNNPGMLYLRDLHSNYFKILSEQGIAGIAMFCGIVWDFWRRNLALRSDAAHHRWRQLGGTLRLRAVASGLEAAMVAWLGIAAVYSTGGKHWFYTILALNLLLYTLVVDPRRSGRSQEGRIVRVRRARGRTTVASSK